MSLLSSLATSNDIASEKDSVGGGFVLDTNLYNFTVKLAYLQKADSDALSLVVHLTTEDGKDVRQQFWMTSGKEKGCKSKVIIGGACITQSFADEIGADGYSKDAAECVRLVERLLA